MESLQQIYEEFSLTLFDMDITSMTLGEFEEIALNGFKEYLMKHMSFLIKQADDWYYVNFMDKLNAQLTSDFYIDLVKAYIL